MMGQAGDHTRRGRAFTGASDTLFVAPGADHIGEVQAWNVDTGKRVWTHTFATSANWGPMLATGGGLVFSGGTNDRKFRAFDAIDGAAGGCGSSVWTADRARRQQLRIIDDQRSVWRQMLLATLPSGFDGFSVLTTDVSWKNETWPDGRAKYVPHGLRIVEALLLEEFPEGGCRRLLSG